MGESKKYNVPSAEFQDNTIGWCGGRLLVKITIFISLIIYLTGSIITGIAYRVYEGLPVNCTMDARFDSTHIYVYETPFVVVGPCFMSAGGAVLLSSFSSGSSVAQHSRISVVYHLCLQRAFLFLIFLKASEDRLPGNDDQLSLNNA